MSGVRTIGVAEGEDGLRLDRWFKRHFPELPHGRLEKLLRAGQIRIDGRRARANTRLEVGQAVRVPPLGERSAAPPRPAPPPEIDEATRAELEARVLYRDDWLIALDKPAGLAVQGGSGQKRHLDALLPALVPDGAGRPRLVHRLDRDTSGVLLLALSAKSATALAAAFRGRTTRKLYWALVAGLPPRPQGRISLALAKRGAPGRQRMAVEADGDEGASEDAVTHYKLVAKHGRRAAWLVLMPETGRTHQLRVHCVALGTPILGDGKYGGREAFPEPLKLPAALMLHAREIAIPHPADGTTLRVRAPLPSHMVQAWGRLGFDSDAGERAGEILAEAALG